MHGWSMVAVVAIIVWGIVQVYRPRRGDHTPSRSSEHDKMPFMTTEDRTSEQREIENLRERIKVLERIATDGNSLDASETRRISQEIEALRDRQDN